MDAHEKDKACLLKGRDQFISLEIGGDQFQN